MINSDLCYVHEGAHVSPGARLGDHVVVYPGAEIAEDSEVMGYTQIWPGVRIHQNAMIGPGVALEPPGPDDFSDIVIGKRCEIRANATVLKGVTINEGAIVEPGSVVAHNVPPYAIVSGNPARITGYVDTLQYEKENSWHKLAEFPELPNVVRLGVGNVTLHRFRLVKDPRGDLSFGEFPRELPFNPKRFFLVHNVPGEHIRGQHAHHECHQFLICISGSCAVILDDGQSRSEVRLESLDTGIYLPPLTWAIQYKYSRDAIMLVFASHYYDPADYIRDYDKFIELIHQNAAK